MKIYFFQRRDNFNFKDLSSELESCGFDGILFPWSAKGDDYFTNIANNIDPQSKIKYMVAIRPYTISPQYLSKINTSMNKISKDRILINFVTGWVEDYEKSVGGILGSVNDLSSSIQRSNYMLEYLKTLNTMIDILPKFYISCTNHVVFKSTKENKIIVPYSWYEVKMFDLDPSNSMLHIAPIIRDSQDEIDSIDKKDWPQDTAFFTKDQFKDLIGNLKDMGFDGVLLSDSLSDEEFAHIRETVKEIKDESMR